MGPKTSPKGWQKTGAITQKRKWTPCIMLPITAFLAYWGNLHIRFSRRVLCCKNTMK